MLLLGGALLAQVPVRTEGRKRVAELNERSFALRKSFPDSSIRLAREAVVLASSLGDSIGLALAYKRIALVQKRRSDVDSALWYTRRALGIEQAIGHRVGIMGSAQNIAELLRAKGELEQARDMYTLALDLAKALDNDDGQALAYNGLGMLYQRAGDFDRATESFFQALGIRKRMHDDAGESRVQFNLGNLYYHFERLDKAEEHYQAYLEKSRALGVAEDMGLGYMNLGNVHAKKDRALAVFYYDSALVRFRAIGDPTKEADVLLDRGGVHIGSGAYEEAQREIEQALALYGSKNDPRGPGKCHLKLGELARLRGDLPGADVHLQRALDVFNALGDRTEVPEVLNERSRLRRAQGRLDEALVLLQRYQQMKDSLFGRERNDRLAAAEMREKFDTEQRIAEIKELKAAKALEAERRQRGIWQRNAMVGICALLGLALVLLVRDLRHRKRLARQEHDLYEQRINEMMRQQEIRSLDAMMEGQEKERKRVAQDLHDRLGSMLSAIKLQFGVLDTRLLELQADQKRQYHHVFTLLDDAVGEVRRISHDMVSSSLARFGLKGALEDLRATLEAPGKLAVELDLFGLDERLDHRVEIATYRMVQECVGNALKHARADQLSIQVTRSAGMLNVIVEDNGVGFDPAQASEGMGLGNLRQRAAAIGGVVQLDSRAGRGTSVSIDIPLPGPERAETDA